MSAHYFCIISKPGCLHFNC